MRTVIRIANCLQCNKEIPITTVKPNQKYCSRECMGKWYSKHQTGSNNPRWSGGKKTIACKHCGKEIQVIPARVDRKKFCSKECMDNERRTIEPRECLQCGKVFMPKNRNNSKKYCSKSCYSTSNRGEGNPRWRGGISFEPYPPSFNNVFKRMIRERDNYTCAICGKRGKDVHHINYVKEETNPENCITLCRPCHTKTNSNRSYWQSFFASKDHDRTPKQT